MKRWHIGGAAVAMLAASVSTPAISSGDPRVSTTYLDVRGGRPAEQQAQFAGRMGVVMPDGPQGMLFVQWRLLHGLKVGPVGAELVARYKWVEEGPDEGATGWLATRGLVSGVSASPHYLTLDKPDAGGFEYTPNCNTDAMNTAAATLKARVASHGADNPAVRAWVLTQDQVFYQCGALEAQPLAPLMADAPEWLVHDRAYQEAA